MAHLKDYIEELETERENHWGENASQHVEDDQTKWSLLENSLGEAQEATNVVEARLEASQQQLKQERLRRQQCELRLEEMDVEHTGRCQNMQADLAEWEQKDQAWQAERTKLLQSQAQTTMDMLQLQEEHAEQKQQLHALEVALKDTQAEANKVLVFEEDANELLRAQQEQAARIQALDLALKQAEAEGRRVITLEAKVNKLEVQVENDKQSLITKEQDGADLRLRFAAVQKKEKELRKEMQTQKLLGENQVSRQLQLVEMNRRLQARAQAASAMAGAAVRQKHGAHRQQTKRAFCDSQHNGILGLVKSLGRKECVVPGFNPPQNSAELKIVKLRAQVEAETQARQAAEEMIARLFEKLNAQKELDAAEMDFSGVDVFYTARGGGEDKEFFAPVSSEERGRRRCSTGSDTWPESTIGVETWAELTD